MEREGAAGDGWRVCARPRGGVAHAVPDCRACGGGGVAVVCDGFECCFHAWVSREWGECFACCVEPVGVEGNIFAGLNVEEVGAADGECAGGCGELDHCLGRVGGVAGGDACGVAVFVGNVVAFFQVAECDSFPGAAILVGDVPAGIARVAAVGGVVRVCGHLCSPFPSRFFVCLRAVSACFSVAFWVFPVWRVFFLSVCE